VAARITAAAEIVVVIVAATVAVADAGAAVADVNAAVGAHRVQVDAIYRPPNMLRRKAASLAVTILAATIIVAKTTAASEARKIAVARRVVSNLAAPLSAALIIVRRNLPVPPLPALSRKNPFFSRASLSPSIVASLRPRPFRPSSRRNLTSRNQKSKKHLRARRVTWLPFPLQDLLAATFPVVSPVDFPAGS
jgi:hypothetical protein